MKNEVIAKLKEGKTFVLFMHLRPDGDSVGSSLALAYMLRKLGKEVDIALDGEVPELYHFLPGSTIESWLNLKNKSYDFAVFLDCGDRDRVGEAQAIASQAKESINIDHHPTNTHFADYNWVDASAAAVGEMVYELIKELGELDQTLATYIYTAIITDTGNFMYENTTGKTHTITADLLKHGIKPSSIAQAVYENVPVESLLLLTEVLNTLKFHSNRCIATMELTQDILKRTGASSLDAEGFINYARSVKGVEIAILFYEDSEESIRVSFRSKTYVDVARIASILGGGGHARAAGCTLNMPLEEAKIMVLEVSTRELKA